MEIRHAGGVPTRRAAADAFTGVVWQDPVIEAPAPARIRAARVSFEPGARTAWHTHPLGQTLWVLAGVGELNVEVVFDPPWGPDRMTEAARLELGFF